MPYILPVKLLSEECVACNCYEGEIFLPKFRLLNVWVWKLDFFVVVYCFCFVSPYSHVTL